ncbi:Uncharacterized membrane protein HdeD, DUF308 family [Paracoccus halophilus]|uniref:Uncharacterized membrane protein HdeD, DUF308 family n=1 Tax=Paracoccus halophilus TaxID=376733 RepID=A0A099F810_9RHOB|nr:DUF308 domain-containing protein [Paracoccus halophilus]KGJ06363.1 hypothetical protein IT41_01590 [Paracoccus halophilus]SFA38864.1 Uncharacterized membrane protein HdeD, DUF308 family [Paracoccus halophilus]
MTSWFPMMAAGIAALTGGLLALINPVSASVTTVTLAGWALLIVAALQGWSAWRSPTTSARIRAGLIAAAALFLGLSLLLGPFGDGGAMRLLTGGLLIASGGAKLWAARSLKGTENMPLVLGAGAVSALMGLVVILGLNLDFGILLGIELLASGLALVLLAMHRRRNNA